MAEGYSHVVGFDDGPFEPGHRGDVLLVGAVYDGPRLVGVLSGIGADAAGRALRRLAIHGALPEPLRVAHLIAGGIARGESRHRP